MVDGSVLTRVSIKKERLRLIYWHWLAVGTVGSIKWSSVNIFLVGFMWYEPMLIE